MNAVREISAVVERECTQTSQVPVGLADDIRCAARSDVPVLITGTPEQGREIACAIDRWSRTPNGAVDVVDCRRFGAFGMVMSHAARYAAGAGRPSTLLLQEIHAFSRDEQAQFEYRLAQLRVSRRNSGLRIMASSSAPLFECVRDGSFDERLFYRLNVIHMVVGGRGSPLTGAN